MTSHGPGHDVTRRGFIGAAGATALAAGFGTRAAAQSTPIRVGWIVAVSGIFATNAQAQDYGLRRAIDDLNSGGGLLDRKIELIARDSAADPAKAVSFAKELVYSGDIDVLVGPISSGEVLPTLGIVSAAKKLHFVVGAVDELTDPVKYPLAFRNLNTNTQWLRVGVNAMLDELKRTKIAIFNDNTGNGLLTVDRLTQLLAERGIKPVYSVNIDPNKPDVTDEILKARALGADVITVWSNATGYTARLLNARGEQKWDVPVVGAPSTLLQAQTAQLLTKPAYLDQVYCPVYRNSILEPDGKFSPAVQGFIDSHASTIGPFMGAGIGAILQGHAAITLYAAGVRKAGSTDPFKVKTALETIPVIDTPYGKFSYSPTNHNGYRDDGFVLIAANAQRPNGGYPPLKPG